MKKKILFIIAVGFLLSCSNDDQDYSEAKLIGNWTLIEVLADPGNGSGTFQSVESTKTIECRNDGVITTNSSLCDPYSDELISSGIYSTSNNTITTNCQNTNIATIYFELENQYLILNFISNEGYAQKFQKMD